MKTIAARIPYHRCVCLMKEQMDLVAVVVVIVVFLLLLLLFFLPDIGRGTFVHRIQCIMLVSR